MYPLTRARTSTASGAANRPVYTSQSVTLLTTGRATVTGGVVTGSETFQNLTVQL